MSITISKDELLKQLPRSLQIALIAADDLPPTFTFNQVNTVEAEEKKSHAFDALRIEYEAITKVVAPIHFNFFCELYLSPEGVTIENFSKYCRDNPSDIHNLVLVHIYWLRKMLKKHGFPFEIKTYRREIYRNTMYRMFKLEQAV